MGGSLSALFFDPNGSSVSVQAKPGLGDLPESCVASIIARLDPPEICKLAKLNRAFRCASLADVVWESKLPSNYRTLIEKVLGDLKENMSKREIYARLCGVNTLDGGTKVIMSRLDPRKFENKILRERNFGVSIDFFSLDSIKKR